MKFSDLKLETQLYIITELSQLETSTHNNSFIPNRDDIEKANISAAKREELRKHNLSVKCLTNSIDSLRIGFMFNDNTSTSPGVVVGNSTIGPYLTFNKNNYDTQDISINFGGTSRIDGLTSDTPIQSTIGGRMSLSDKRTLRDSLQRVWEYTNPKNDLDEVSNVIAKLIETYDIAMTLPEDLVDFINSWIPSKIVMSLIASKIQHSGNQHFDGDNEEEYTTTGYDSYIISNVYRECGIEVAHAFNSRSYNNYRLTVSHTQKEDTSEGVLSVYVSFGGKDRILLKEAEIAPDLTVAETIDFFAGVVESIKENDEWGVKLNDLIDHLYENIIEVKPFILNSVTK